jgi:hypothetical protein
MHANPSNQHKNHYPRLCQCHLNNLFLQYNLCFRSSFPSPELTTGRPPKGQIKIITTRNSMIMLGHPYTIFIIQNCLLSDFKYIC